MRVEIQILSGARQGECVALEADRFRVGDQRDCEVFFNPSQDAPAQGHAATIQRGDDGWRIRNSGTGDILVNHEPVFGNARLRSGDVVRMSEHGPDFCFTVGQAAVLNESAAPNTAVFRPLPSPLEMNELTTGHALATPRRSAGRATIWRKLTPGVLLGLLVALLALLGMWIILRP